MSRVNRKGGTERKKLKEKALKLRIQNELSYDAIRKRLGVPKSTLSNWLSSFPLSKEKILELRRKAWKKNETKIELFRASMRQKRQEKDEQVYKEFFSKFSKISKNTIFASGLMLYLAEGSKSGNYNTSLANTDPRVIRFFVGWLSLFFTVPREKMRVQLHLYESMDIEKEQKFWKNELGFRDSQFYKHYITKFKKSSFLYRESFRHGTCSVTVSGTLLKRRVIMAIRAYLDRVLSLENLTGA